MYSDNRKGSRAAPARGFMALFAMLAMGLASMALPAEAAPFAYVANTQGFQGFTSSVTVIDTATNLVLGSPIEFFKAHTRSLAVTPDGKHVYVASAGNTFVGFGGVSVIDTATNMVVATVPGVNQAEAVVIAPDGKHAYAGGSVIDTGTNMVVATTPVGGSGTAITPDGKQAYVVSGGVSPKVFVYDIATNLLVARSQWGFAPIASPSPRMGHTPM